MDTRVKGDGVRRRRICFNGHTFATTEEAIAGGNLKITSTCTFCGKEGHRASHCPVRERKAV